MSKASLNFTHISAFDPAKDIVWSFSYKIENTGTLPLDGGFTTYLDFSVPTVSGSENTLGYSNNYNPINNSFLVAAFDVYGSFCQKKSDTFTTGIASRTPNTLTIRLSTNYTYLTSIPLASFFPLSAPDFQSLRFQLTNLGNTFNVFYMDGDSYQKITSIETGKTFVDSEKLYIGMSWSSNACTSKLKIKDFHYQAQN